jgi:hypothetical protein
MAQSATTVTPGNPTPPTNLSFVGARPPLDPAQTAADDGVTTVSPASINEPPSPARNVFAVKTAAAGSGTSVDHEGRGNETLFTQTYSASIYAPIALTMDGCGPALTQGTMPIPNQIHASSLSPATNPTLTTIAPTTAVHGASGTDTITCTGTGFNPQSVIYVAGVAVRPTTFTSATTISAAVPKQVAAGAVPVTVVTGGVVTTAPQTLTYS